MAEENKHPPTTEEQAPPEMPGKAPKMEQAEIPDVGGGPAPSAKVIDLFRCAFHAGKGCSDGHPQGAGSPACFRHRVQQAGMEKPMPEPEKPKPKRGRPAKAEKATPTEPGAKKEVKAEKPRRGRPPKAEKSGPGAGQAAQSWQDPCGPRGKAAPPAPEVPPTPRDATRAEKRGDRLS